MLIVNYTVRNAGIMTEQQHFKLCDRLDVFLPIQDIFVFGTPENQTRQYHKINFLFNPIVSYNFAQEDTFFHSGL